MNGKRHKPGVIRDAITVYLGGAYPDARSIGMIHSAVCEIIGGPVSTSSVRSYLRLNTPSVFTRTARGHYRLNSK